MKIKRWYASDDSAGYNDGPFRTRRETRESVRLAKKSGVKGVKAIKVEFGY